MDLVQNQKLDYKYYSQTSVHLYTFSLLPCLTEKKAILKKMMALWRKPLMAHSYSKMEKEEPEERIHRRAQFLIYKVLDQVEADYSRRRQSWLRLRISKLKVKIGTRLRRFRKKLLSGASAPKSGFHAHLKAWRRLLCRATQPITFTTTLPPLFKWFINPHPNPNRFSKKKKLQLVNYSLLFTC